MQSFSYLSSDSTGKTEKNPVVTVEKNPAVPVEKSPQKFLKDFAKNYESFKSFKETKDKKKEEKIQEKVNSLI